MHRVPDIELIPPSGVTTSVLSEQQFDRHAEALRQARDANDVLRDDEAIAALFGAEFLEMANWLVVLGAHLASEQAIETHFA
jgi:hypothetical protein